MRILKKMLKQYAVYWPPEDRIDRYGNAIVSNPIQLRCRWEDTDTLITEQNGKEVQAMTEVYVSEDVKQDGWIWFGKLADLEGSMVRPSNALQIRKFEKIPTINCRKFARIVYG